MEDHRYIKYQVSCAENFQPIILDIFNALTSPLTLNYFFSSLKGITFAGSYVYEYITDSIHLSTAQLQKSKDLKTTNIFLTG